MNHKAKAEHTNQAPEVAAECPLPNLKVGDRVLWQDPKDSSFHPIGKVTWIPQQEGEPLRADMNVTVMTDENVEHYAKPTELVLLGEREHAYALNGRAIAPYDFEHLADLTFYYRIRAKADKTDALRELYGDNRVNSDHLKGFVLRQVFAADPVIQALGVPGDNAAADEEALIAMVAAYGSTDLKICVAEDTAKGWAGDRRCWHNESFGTVHLAFKVKPGTVDLRPEQEEKLKTLDVNLEPLFEQCQAWVWSSWSEALSDLAQSLGKDTAKATPAGVISEGRMGGWAAPCIASPGAKEFNERHALGAEEVKLFLADVEATGKDPEYDFCQTDLVDLTNRILILRQFQCHVDWVMSHTDMIWQDFVDEAIEVIEAEPRKGTGLREAGRQSATGEGTDGGMK